MSESGHTETRLTVQPRSAFESIADPLGASSLGLWPVFAITSCRIKPSNSMLGLRPTTPQDYPEWSGFGRRREREWGHRRQRAAGIDHENPLMRIYIIANDGITLSREAPAALAEGEIAVVSKEELHAAPLNGKRLLALWNALPGSRSGKRSVIARR